MTAGSDFLSRFVEGDERDVDALLSDLGASAQAKAADSRRLRVATLKESRSALENAAHAIAANFHAGGRLFTFGNGGSSTDAAGVAALFACPPVGNALPARSLVDDTAVPNPLGNHIGI